MSVLDELKKLISIPSVTGNEAEIGKYLFDRFKITGCRTELFEVTKDRFNVLAVFPGEMKEEFGVLFHAHMDTVLPYKMESPFVPLIKNNHVWGRGSVDQKGGIAAVIVAFERLFVRHEKLKMSVGFVGVIDEESEHRGSMFLKNMGIKSRYAVVTEPSGLKVGIGCKGTVPVKITVHGKSSHGCRPWLGKNAVEYGIKIAEDVISSDLPVMKIENIGKTSATINLGIIQGGVAYNIVPDECVIWFDRRLIPGESPHGAVIDIERIVEKYNRIRDISVRVEIARPDWDWEPIKKRGLKPALTPLVSDIVTVVRNSHREILKYEPITYFTDGYNEMDFLINDLGIPTIQYGPGDANLCHTNNEMMDIEQLEKSVDVYSSIIENLCR